MKYSTAAGAAAKVAITVGAKAAAAGAGVPSKKSPSTYTRSPCELGVYWLHCIALVLGYMYIEFYVYI